MSTPTPVLTTLPVFCTADMKSLRDKKLKINQYNNFVAFNYGIRCNIEEAFQTMPEKQFKAHLYTIPRCDDGKFIVEYQARQIYNSMTLLTESLGKLIIVAVAKSQGGGLELRRVTGGYRFTDGVTSSTGEQCYFHQFATETIRKLTKDESNLVASCRPMPFALTWTADLMV